MSAFEKIDFDHFFPECSHAPRTGSSFLHLLSISESVHRGLSVISSGARSTMSRSTPFFFYFFVSRVDSSLTYSFVGSTASVFAPSPTHCDHDGRMGLGASEGGPPLVRCVVDEGCADAVVMGGKSLAPCKMCLGGGGGRGGRSPDTSDHRSLSFLLGVVVEVSGDELWLSDLICTSTDFTGHQLRPVRA